mgnify:FL=1
MIRKKPKRKKTIADKALNNMNSKDKASVKKARIAARTKRKELKQKEKASY